MSSCIVVLNIGERPYLEMTLPFFERYSRRIDASLKIVTQPTLSPKTRLMSAFKKARRRNILSYLQKLKSVYEALQEHERVILMDDTCIISGDAPDLMAIVPENAIGGFPEGTLGIASFKRDRQLIQKRRGISVERYFNTGVLVASRVHQDLFSEKTMWQHRDLFFESHYPTQAYLAFMIAKFAIPAFALEEKFNFMHLIDYYDDKNRSLKEFPLEHLVATKGACIHHITGYYRERRAIIRQICNFLTT